MTEKCPTTSAESDISIRILLLEGDRRDAEALKRKLDADGLNTTTVCVDNREDYERALAEEPFDLILCGENIAGYDSATALKKAAGIQPSVPAIVISSSASEDQRGIYLHWGAKDYLLKHRLERLVPKVKHALQEESSRYQHQQSQKELRESEARFRQLVELSPVATYVCDRAGRILDYNRETCALWGRSPTASDRFCGSYKVYRPDGTFLPRSRNPMAITLNTGKAVRNVEVVFERPDGTRIPAIFNSAPLKTLEGELQGAIGSIIDISAHKQLEKKRIELLEQERIARREAEAAGNYFRSLFESAPGLYLVLSPDDYKIVGVSEAYLRSTMTRREDIIGKRLFEVFPNASEHPEYDTTLNLRASLERVKRLQRVDVMAVQRYPIPRPDTAGDGFEERYWSALNSPVLGPDGKLAYIIHRVEDVTDFIRLKERDADPAEDVTLETRGEQMEADIVLRSQELQRLNNQLQESEKRFRELAENIEEVFFDFDPNQNQLLYVSPAYEAMWGQSSDALYADPEAFMETIHPEDKARAVQDLCRSVAGKNVDVECRLISPEGSTRWVHVKCYPVCSAEGSVEHIVGTANDITARKLAELKLARSNRALRMISACNEAIIRAENEHSLLKEVCQIAVDIGGYQMAWAGYAQDDPDKAIVPVAHAGDEAGYLALMNLTWSSDEPRGQGPAGRTIRTGEPLVLEDLTKDPSFIPWLQPAWQRGYRSLISLPLRHEQRTFGLLTLYSGEMRAVAAEEVKFLQDLTEDLAYGIGGIRSEQSRKQLHSAVLKVAAAVSASTGIEFFQQLVCKMAEVLGAKAGFVARMLPDKVTTARTIAAAVNGEVIDNFDYSVVKGPCNNLRDNDYWIERALVAERYPESPGGIVGGEGYVGMRLNSSEGEHLGQLFVVFSQPLEQTDFIVSTLKIFAARVVAELERREADTRIREQASLLDKAHDAIVVIGMDNQIQFWNKGAERLYGWSASEALDCSVETLLYQDFASFQRAVNRVLRQGEWRGHIEQRHRDGQKLTVEGHWTLVRHDDGRPKSILAINADISKRLAVEEQLQQAQRLNAVGELTGGVAHDFNNLLTVILGNSELLIKRLADQPDLRSIMEMTQAAAKRGATLTHRLLAFSRRQVLEPRPTNINALITGMDGLLRRTLREDIHITINQGQDLWSALVDQGQLEAALLNLCINARDAMDGGGELTITTSNAQLEADDMNLPGDIVPGSYVMIEVADTGKGIAPQDLPRVFEPFFTTKAKGEGTGLGLSIVYGFIKQSKGHITIDSEVGRGTQVKMYLPKVSETASTSDKMSVEENEIGGSEQILLVEDDDLVRLYAESALRTLGYRVIVASNGPEALETIKKTQDIDLLFTDVIMPGGLNGPELVAEAHKLRPSLKVLYTSGYTENALTQSGSANSDVQLLNKPYSRQTLAQKIRSALSKG